jgi:hypothetical protein
LVARPVSENSEAISTVTQCRDAQQASGSVLLLTRAATQVESIAYDSAHVVAIAAEAPFQPFSS